MPDLLQTRFHASGGDIWGQKKHLAQASSGPKYPGGGGETLQGFDDGGSAPFPRPKKGAPC